MNPLLQISTRIPNSNIMIQKIVMTKLNRKASAISSTMKGTKNLVKTISYSIQHFYHPDHSEIQRRAVPKFHSSLVHILFQHSAWQRLTVHFSKIPGKNNNKKKIRQGSDNTVCVEIYLIRLCKRWVATEKMHVRVGALYIAVNLLHNLWVLLYKTKIPDSISYYQ
jgi:hypothetical protein